MGAPKLGAVSHFGRFVFGVFCGFCNPLCFQFGNYCCVEAPAPALQNDFVPRKHTSELRCSKGSRSEVAFCGQSFEVEA